MPYPMHLFAGYPTLRTCPVCRVQMRLNHFRRWVSTPAGDKRMLHDACNTCDPERTLSEMTPTQRLRAVEADHPRARLMVVENMNDAERSRALTSLKGRKRGELLARHAQERRRAWREAIGARVSAEHEWATRTLESMRLAALGAGPVRSTAPSALQSQELAQTYAQSWVEFFTAYVQVLKLMKTRIHTLSNKAYSPIRPTPEQSLPDHYADANTRTSLRLLYGACKPLPGRRLMRDPWCLSWGQE